VWVVWHNWGRVTVLFVISVPVAILAGYLWTRLRVRRGGSAWHAVTEAIMLAGTAPWLGPLLARNPNQLASRRLMLAPLADVAEQFSGGPRYIAIELGGNLAVFAVLGFFLPLRYRIGLWPVIAIAGLASASIETAQYVLDLHRVTSIDDVIINTAGAVLGALASRHWWRRRRSAPLATGTQGSAVVSSSERPQSTSSSHG
jgi:hypothetical protein